MNIGDIVYVGKSTHHDHDHDQSHIDTGWGIVFDNNGHYLSGEGWKFNGYSGPARARGGSFLLIEVMASLDIRGSRYRDIRGPPLVYWGPYLSLQRSIYMPLKKYIQKHNIKYENTFRDIMNSKLGFEWFDLDYYGKEEFDSIVNDYKKYNIW